MVNVPEASKARPGLERKSPDKDAYDHGYFEEGRDSAYEQGYDAYIESQNYEEMVADITARLKPVKVLDVGCAYGKVVEMFLDLGVDAYGVDISEFALSNAPGRVRGRLKRVDLEKERAPFPDCAFDVVLCLAVIEHLHDDTNLLKELARLVSSGGAIYLVTPPSSYGPAWRDKTHINLHEPDYWQERFAQFGFNTKPLRMHETFGFVRVKARGLGECMRRTRREKPTSKLGLSLPRPIWVLAVSVLRLLQNKVLYERNRFIMAYLLTKRC